MASLDFETKVRKFSLTANQLLSLKRGAKILGNEIEIAIILALYKDTRKHNVWRLQKDAKVSRATFARRLRKMCELGWLTRSHKQYYLSPTQKKLADHLVYATFIVGECATELYADLEGASP